MQLKGLKLGGWVIVKYVIVFARFPNIEKKTNTIQ